MGIQISKEIQNEINNKYFAILVDESADNADYEQLTLVLRYLNKFTGEIMERNIKTVHIKNGDAKKIKYEIDITLKEYNLLIDYCRGQGYDNANVMSGRINGLSTLILTENHLALYIHCAAHRFNLVTQKIGRSVPAYQQTHGNIQLIYVIISSSPKRIREFESIQQNLIDNNKLNNNNNNNNEETNLENNETNNNPKRILKLVGQHKIGWSCHHKSTVRVQQLFGSIIKVLRSISQTADTSDQQAQAVGLLNNILQFQFIF